MKSFNLLLPASLILAFSLSAATTPCDAQFLKKLEQTLMQGQGMYGGQGQLAGNTSLPAGQYMVTNMQTGQGFYLTVNPQGQMFVSSPAPGQQQMMPGANGQGLPPQGVTNQSGFGGMMKGSMGNFLKNELAPASQPIPQQIPQQLPPQQY